MSSSDIIVVMRKHGKSIEEILDAVSLAESRREHIDESYHAEHLARRGHFREYFEHGSRFF